MLERALDAMRRAWRGGPEMRRDIVVAVTALRQIAPQVASTHEIATILESSIDALLHLPRDEQDRRDIITRQGKQLAAIKPLLGIGDGPANVGKLNSALGEKRAGRPEKERSPRVVTVRPLPPDALITELPHVGPKVAQRYEEGLGLHTIEDILRMVPRRHIDYSNTIRLDDPIGLQGDVTVRGKLVEIREIRGAGTPRVQARIFDGTGSLRITWFSTFIAKQLAEGDEIVVSGTIQSGYGALGMTNPEWERVGKDGLSTGRLIPVYALTKGCQT
jgi:hypothetical protein